jgi:hypothetical protein
MKKAGMIFIIVLLAISCRNDKSEKTKIFSDYLSSTFSLSIPNDEHYFVLLPERVCAGCVFNSQIELNDYLNVHSEMIDKITFIYSDIQVANTDLIQRLQSFYDEQHNLDNKIPAYTFGIGNLTIVKTKKGKVRQVTIIDIGQLNKIDSLMQCVLK